MRILFTGASSFTGYWLVKTLTARGHEVTACLQAESLENYAGVRKARIQNIKNLAQLEFGVSFGSARFFDLLEKENYDVLCHHGANVTNYKSQDFDFLAATASNTHNLKKVIPLAQRRVQAIVLTSSVFEAGMGVGELPHRAFNPYGLSKTLTREIFSYYCAVFKLPLKVFVIPNPFGVLEEPRFVNYLVESWSKNITPSVKTPLYIRDNIPIDLLALAYADFVEKSNPEFISYSYPQGYVESQGQFAERCARQFSQRLGIQFNVQLEEQRDFSEPLTRVNTESVRIAHPEWNEAQFWQQYVDYYREKYFS